MDDNIRKKISTILNKERYCSIATTNGQNIHNSLVAFYSENFNIYFGAFSDSLKIRNAKINPAVALVINSIQYHGRVQEIPYESDEYYKYYEKYSKKFPEYEFYFGYETNELFKIVPLVIWLYDSSKGIMHRDKIIFDNEYYINLDPYEIPSEFITRK